MSLAWVARGFPATLPEGGFPFLRRKNVRNLSQPGRRSPPAGTEQREASGDVMGGGEPGTSPGTQGLPLKSPASHRGLEGDEGSARVSALRKCQLLSQTAEGSSEAPAKAVTTEGTEGQPPVGSCRPGDWVQTQKKRENQMSCREPKPV